MHILHVIPHLDHGGAERSVIRLAQQLIDAGHEQSIVCLGHRGRLAPLAEQVGVKVFSLGATGPANLPRVAGQLISLLRANRPDVVQTWMYHADLVAGLIARVLRIPVVWGVRTTALTSSEARTTRALVRVAAPLSRVVPNRIVYNAATAETAHLRKGFARHRGVVICNGVPLPVVDDRRREEARAALGFTSEEVVITRVARYAGVKDFPTLLRALGAVARDHKEVRVLLCGPGTEESNEELTRLVRRHGLEDRTVRLGAQADVDVVHAAADLACSSSRAEGFPNVIAEAMAWGLPVVATDAGDSAQIVGSAGHIVAVGDADGMAAAVSSLVTDTDRRRSLGSTARSRVIDHLSVARMTEAYEALYAEVLSGAGSSDSSCSGRRRTYLGRRPSNARRRG